MRFRSLLTVAAFLLAGIAAQASPITYNFIGTLGAYYGGGTITGQMTVNNNSLTTFSFTMPDNLPGYNQVGGGGYILNNSNSYVNTFGTDYWQIADYDTVNYLSLHFSSLPGALIPGGGFLEQATNGRTWNYTNTFNGTATLATPVPEPSAILLFLTGTLLLAGCAWRHARWAVSSCQRLEK